MTAKELIGILLESPLYLYMKLRERQVLVKTLQYFTLLWMNVPFLKYFKIYDTCITGWDGRFHYFKHQDWKTRIE